MSTAEDERILVLMPTEKDGARTARMLSTAGLVSTVCSDVHHLCREIRAGAAVALLTEEFVETDSQSCLRTAIREQPVWSDFPLIVLAHERGHVPHIRESMNVTFVERPAKTRSLMSVIRAALRTRRHQYGLRDDLEQKKQAETERARLVETLHLTVDAGNFGTWEWEPQTDRMLLSDRAAEIYGVDPGGSYQREVMRALLHPDYRDPARKASQRAVTERSDYEIEYPILRPDGSLVWALVRGRGSYSPAGSLVRMLGVVQDITERKLAEKTLRESEERHRLLASLAEATQALNDPHEVMAVTARLLAEHFKADRCAYAEVENETHFHITGDYSVGVPSIKGLWPLAAFGAECARSMLANEPFAVDDSENDPRIAPHDLAAYRATTIRAVICVPLHKEGHLTAAMAIQQATPRRWQSHEVQLVSMIVARCWEALERVRAVERLRESDRKKDEFIALLAHELRNPLAPVRNGLQVLELAGDNPLLAAQTREMMERQLSHMVRLIDDLLDISRISRNKMELRRSRVLLSEVIHTAIETAQPTIDAEQQDLHLSLPQRPILLEVDLTRLAQVFSNLLINSAKYTPRGGRIWLTADLQEGHIAVSVRDNGIGIPLEFQGHIFDMFSQVDRSVERSTGGLGIGLALVKGVVEMHGGTVTVASAGPGQGSEFVVLLPVLLDEADQTSGVPSEGGSPASTSRILVVDDNRDGAATMTLMLKLLGNEVCTAHDGVEAIDVAEQFRPDVILMDVGMPRMNGYEATRRIRQLPWGEEVAIIALTGWGQDHDRISSREAGCDGHLVKPIQLEELQQELARSRTARTSHDDSHRNLGERKTDVIGCP